ncbi:MAG TPA: anti-sigma factor [Candidatus Sulfotelmatobacter sp.]
MTCVELQQSLSETDHPGTAEQRQHLNSCRDCSALVEELALIISSAPSLLEADEPSPRVWNSIEIALRQEGLIRPQRPARSLIPPSGTRWTWARWIVPASAVLLILIGVYVNQHSLVHRLFTDAAVRTPVSKPEPALAGLNDDELLQEISGTSPVMQAQYRDSLRRANEFIQDAQETLNANPNDEEARRSLMEAYQQKSMLFEMAMDRSLP